MERKRENTSPKEDHYNVVKKKIQRDCPTSCVMTNVVDL